MPFTSTLKFVSALIIDSIDLSADNADVVRGKTYIGKNKAIAVGTLPLLNTYSNLVLNCSESHTVEYGKNPVAYTVTARSLAEQTVGTATAADMKLNTTGWVNGVLITGEMPLNMNIDITIGADQTYTIPLGYHPGTGTVKAQALGPQTAATATAAEILHTKTAWVNGVLITGEMPNRTSTEEPSISLSCGESYTILNGYYSGGLVTARTLAEQTSASTPVRYTWDESTSQYVSEDIALGYQAWINGLRVTGNISRIAAAGITLPLNGTYTIPAGIHTGAGYVTQSIPVHNEAINITPSKTQSTIDYTGNYLGTNAKIIVQGVDALAYQRTINTLYDGDLTFEDGIATYVAAATNWRNNVSVNVYGLDISNFKDATADLVASGTIILAKDFGQANLPASSLMRIQVPGTSGITLTFDGTVTGKTYVGPSSTKCYVKLSDNYASVDGFIGRTIKANGETTGTTVTSSMISYPTASDTGVFNITYLPSGETVSRYVIVTNRATTVTIDDTEYDITAGIWVYYVNESTPYYVAEVVYDADNTDSFTVQVTLSLRESDNAHVFTFKSLNRTLTMGRVCIKEYLREIAYT